MTGVRLGAQLEALRTHLTDLARVVSESSAANAARVEQTLDELAVTTEALDMARREVREQSEELESAQTALRERERRIVELERDLAAAQAALANRAAAARRRVALTIALAVGLALAWLVAERLR